MCCDMSFRHVEGPDRVTVCYDVSYAYSFVYIAGGNRFVGAGFIQGEFWILQLYTYRAGAGVLFVCPNVVTITLYQKCAWS